MDKAHVHYCWRASGGGGREDLWSALCLLWRSAPTLKEQEHGILSPGPSPTPATSLPGCSLKTCCPKTRRERPPKRSWVVSHLKGDEVGRCSRICCSPQGQRWGGTPNSGASRGAPQHHIPVGLMYRSKHSKGIALTAYRRRQGPCTQGSRVLPD